MRKYIFLFIFTALICLNLVGYAQDDTNHVEMADAMRSNGRIYVVVAVVLLILIGLLLYLVRLDKKIARIEKGKE